MRRFSIICGVASALLGLNQAFAGSVNLTLLGAGPTGTIYMTDPSQLNTAKGNYNGDDFYAGVLDWTDQKGATAADIHTYCIDIASVIFVNDPYSFNSGPLSGLSFGLAVTSGLDHLWVDNYNEFQATLSGSVNSTTNQEAADLQIAIWDIIYNGATGTLIDGSKPVSTSPTTVLPPLYFSGDEFGQADLTNAIGIAKSAYNDTTPLTSTSDLNKLATLTAYDATDGSQNQVYLGPPNLQNEGPSPAPLPNMAGSLLVLLGMVGAFGIVSKRPGWVGLVKQVI